jgi:hypothetical protein
MDPNQAWHELADAVTEERWEEAAEIAENLLCWLDRGGFPPKITGLKEFDQIVAKSTCDSVMTWDIG